MRVPLKASARYQSFFCCGQEKLKYVTPAAGCANWFRTLERMAGTPLFIVAPAVKCGLSTESTLSCSCRIFVQASTGDIHTKSALKRWTCELIRPNIHVDRLISCVRDRECDVSGLVLIRSKLLGQTLVCDLILNPKSVDSAGAKSGQIGARVYGTGVTGLDHKLSEKAKWKRGLSRLPPPRLLRDEFYGLA